MKKIKTVRFISNGYGLAEEFIGVVQNKILKESINVTFVKEGIADLVIILGGDGTVISAARETHFDENTIYLAVNFGDKGFLTNIKKEEALEVITDILKKPQNYETQKINVLDIDIVYTNGVVKKQFAFNEIWLKGEDDCLIKFKQYSSEGLLQKFTATGVIVATPAGSTAVAMSAGGPVIINGDVMMSAINLPSEVGTEDRYFKNPIIDTDMDFRFITKKEFEMEQVKKGNVKDGKLLYEHTKYKLVIKVDNTVIDKIYPEEIEKVAIKICKRLQFVKIKDETRTNKMRECILKIRDN